MAATATISITSDAFAHEATIPLDHTCDGRDASPALAWSAPPAGTRSLGLICDDPDAPAGPWVHWVLYDLPPAARDLPEGVPARPELPSGARQGRNDFGRIGYGGPCPPKGPAHRYVFRLYALDVTLELPSGATKKEVEAAMRGHVLAEGRIMGRYGR